MDSKVVLYGAGMSRLKGVCRSMLNRPGAWQWLGIQDTESVAVFQRLSAGLAYRFPRWHSHSGECGSLALLLFSRQGGGDAPVECEEVVHAVAVRGELLLPVADLHGVVQRLVRLGEDEGLVTGS